MIEKIFKNIKYIGLVYLIIDLLFVACTIVYHVLGIVGKMPFSIWYLIVSCVVIGLNIIFAILLLVIKKIRKF